MRDKPENEFHFNIPEDDKPDRSETPEENNTPEKPNRPSETPASPKDKTSNAPKEPPHYSQDEPFRVKDQFGTLDSAPEMPARDPVRPSKAAVPGAGLAESARPGRSIRKENSFQDFFRQLDLIKIMRGIYRKFWIVLLSAFGLMLLLIPAARSLQGGVSYSAKSVIIYTKPTQKQIDTQGSSFLLRPLSQDTLVDMIISPENVGELERDIGLQPLKDSVSFNSQAKSDIVTLQITDMPSEQQAISAVNKLAQIIIENNAEYYRNLAETAYKSYKEQRQSVEKEFNEAVKKVEEFQLEHQILELTTQYENYFSAVNAASERLSVAKVAHEGLLVRIENYVKMIEELPDEVLNESQEENPLKRRISNAEAALLDLRIQYAADNPKILRQEREIEELRSLLKAGNYDETRERTYIPNPLKEELKGELLKLRSEEKVAAQQVIALQNDLAELQSQFKELPRLEKEYAALLEARAQAEAALKTLKASEESARLTMNSNLSDFKMLNRASEAEATAASLIGKIIPIVGFIFGFFGGLVLVVGIELLDSKIRTQQQLESAYDAPCLASIVEIPHLDRYDTYGLLLPSLREISDRLNVVLQGHRAKVLGFFSSQDREGKSVLAFNLARYYSTLNIKVLYVGFDTRPVPGLPDGRDLGWPQKGIEDYLRNTAELSDMLTTVHGVDIIRAQEPHGDLLDLAKGSAMPRLWDLLRQNYDLIITEAPSVLDNQLSGTIANFQDEIIYVLASPVSDRRLVDAGLEFLEDRGLIPCSLIFNRVDPYYLEDVRQQRVIRNLSEKKRNPLKDLFSHFSKPESEEPEDSSPDQPTEPPADYEENSFFAKDEEEDWPELIGEEETEEKPEAPRTPPPTQPPPDDGEISFRSWLGDPDEQPRRKDSDDEDK